VLARLLLYASVMKTLEQIDTDQLITATGGVRPGPNGEGCTGPFRPRPTPPRPNQDPLGGMGGSNALPQ
jgi:hypothetical protein